MSKRPGSHIKSFKVLTIVLFVILLGLGIIPIYNYLKTLSERDQNKIDFEEIKELGKLKVVLSTNLIDYFIYQGQPMGFQLEMLESFAKDKNLELEIIIENDSEKGINLLLNRNCDILAQSIINSPERDLLVDFTIPVRKTHLVLIQRTLMSDSVNKQVSNFADTQLKTIYLQKNQANLKSLKNILLDLVRNFHLIEIDSIPSEVIVKNVSEGIFDYAVVDYNIAVISYSYWSNIDYSVEVSLNQNISWCVRPESKNLLDTLNVWLDNYMKTSNYNRLSIKYINNSKNLVDFQSDFYSTNSGVISKYDEKIRKYSQLIDWDWRLVSSLIYEESRFNPNVVSWAGAKGLMQLMPATFRKFNDSGKTGIDAQIYAGIKYLEFLDLQFKDEIPEFDNRVYFILASYNIGPGHVEDAMRLAEAESEDFSSWEVVSHYLSNLSNPKYYKQEVVKHGYFPGIYSVEFAKSIMNRYKQYLNVIPE